MLIERPQLMRAKTAAILARVVSGKPLEGGAQGDLRFYGQICAGAKEVGIDELQPSLPYQTGLGMAMHGTWDLGWWVALQPVVRSTSP